MRVEVFVQARMGSTRLPGKVLKPVLGKPLLEFLVERLRQAKEIADVVILTTTQPADDVIVQFCQKKGIACLRGSEDNVLERYYQAALQRRPDAIVRVTSDCPLIDPEVLDQVVREFKTLSPHIDFVANTLEGTYPRGLDVEVFSFQALEKAFQEAHFPEEFEHVTVYFYRYPNLFRLKNVAYPTSLRQHRWTVDTSEDLALITLILEHLYPRNPYFRLKDILELLRQHPEWSQLNAHIKQKTVLSRKQSNKS